MTTWTFSLSVSGADTTTDEVIDAVYEATDGDGTATLVGGQAFVEFDREADIFSDALMSAISEVEEAGCGLTVDQVQPEDLVSASDIAYRTGRTRESVRLLINGDRGPGNFPAAISRSGKRNPVWNWTEVVHWLTQHSLVDQNEEPALDYEVIAAVNDALRLRRTLSPIPEPERRRINALTSA